MRSEAACFFKMFVQFENRLWIVLPFFSFASQNQWKPGAAIVFVPEASLSGFNPEQLCFSAVRSEVWFRCGSGQAKRCISPFDVVRVPYLQLQGSFLISLRIYVPLFLILLPRVGLIPSIQWFCVCSWARPDNVWLKHISDAKEQKDGFEKCNLSQSRGNTAQCWQIMS